MAKSRWLTPEFFLYYFVIAAAAFFTLKEVLLISLPSHPNHHNYSHLLSRGWLFNLPIDLSDHQFRSFREGIPSLTALFILYIIASRLFGKTGRIMGTGIFVFLLHGFKAFEPVFLLTLNFHIVKLLKRHSKSSKFVIFFTWFYAIGSLFFMERKPDFHWKLWTGFLSHWTVIFKMAILRMISFNFDFNGDQIFGDCACAKKESLCHKCRVQKSACDFNFISYLQYIFYPPLYLSGPILSYNDFYHQNKDSPNRQKRNCFPLVYGLRLLGSTLTLEVILHLFHVCAIKSASAWHESFTPLAFAGVAFLNLKIIWMKLLVIWRFSRFFALCDGIEAPENMIRCMSNNYSMLRFWRSWHRSFNLWVLRYLYIPLGGRKTSNWNMFPIFAFVAIWHDINFQLLAWGALIPLIILPEILAQHLSKRLNLAALSSFRFICGIAAALNILLMMIGNLVGFSVGVEGALLMFNQVIRNGGLRFVSSVFFVFFAASQIMFELREQEYRKTGKFPST